MLGCVVLVAASPGVQLATTQVSPAGQTDSGQPADSGPPAPQPPHGERIAPPKIILPPPGVTKSRHAQVSLRQTRRSNTGCLAEAGASGTEAVFAPPPSAPTEQTTAVGATRGIHARDLRNVHVASHTCRNPKLAALLPHARRTHTTRRRSHHTPARTT